MDFVSFIKEAIWFSFCALTGFLVLILLVAALYHAPSLFEYSCK